MSVPPAHPIPTAAGVSTPTVETRATFGWRPGSIRGLLSLMVLGLLWSVALFSPEWKRDQQIPLIYLYLQYLLVLIIAYYFPPFGSTAARTATDRRMLRLWPELVPWLLVLGSLGLGVFVWQSHREFTYPPSASFTLPLVLLGGFFAGHLLTWVVSHLTGGRGPAWFQDLQAWIALLGMVGLAAELMFHLFILEGLEPERRDSLRASLTQWESVLAGLVAFYYGARTDSPRVSG